MASTNGGANLQFFDSQFGNNSAVVSGGALSVSRSCTTQLLLLLLLLRFLWYIAEIQARRSTDLGHFGLNVMGDGWCTVSFGS